MSVEYFGVHSENSKTINEEIEWEDDVFPAGGEIKVNIKLNMYRIFFGRLISTGDQHEFGASLGTHTMDISTILMGQVYIDEDKWHGGIRFGFHSPLLTVSGNF